MKALRNATVIIATLCGTGMLLNHMAVYTISYWWFIAPMAVFAGLVIVSAVAAILLALTTKTE
jgi:hypothetical protein